MKLKFLVAVMILSMVLALGACSKKEEAPITAGTQQGDPALPEGHPGAPAGGGDGAPFIAPVTSIVVPEPVKGMWSGVKVALENKTEGKSEDVVWALNTDVKISGSALTVKVGDFMPDFRMEGPTITSASTEPNNPAVQIIVMEGDEEIFKGWLYSKWPAIHPFQHDVYAFTLIDGVKK
jgi:hypothetical protein